MKRVLVSYNGTTAYAPTLTAALDEVFGAKPPPTTQPPPSSGPPPNAGNGKITAQVRALVAQLSAAQASADAALRSGDLTAYARAEKRVAALIRQLARATG